MSSSYLRSTLSIFQYQLQIFCTDGAVIVQLTNFNHDHLVTRENQLRFNVYHVFNI